MTVAIGTFSPQSDAATAVDELDRTALMKAFATEVLNCTPPQAFAVHGDWGAGKTSFLLQLKRHLGEQSNRKLVTAVWFEAWRYQNEPVPILALLHEVRKHFSELAFAKAIAKRSGAIVFSGLLNCIGEIIERIGLEQVVLPDQDKLREYAERYDKERFNDPLFSSRIREALQDAIAELFNHLKMPQAKLIIIVDDLDRCSSRATYRLLEELKIYLDLKNCVFVLGINQNEVVKSIAKALNCDAVEASAYLEKLCPNIVRLPLHGRPEDLLLKWLQDKPPHPHLLRLIESDRYLYSGCLPPNPRRIKALANAVGRLWAHACQLDCHPDRILAVAQEGTGGIAPSLDQQAAAEQAAQNATQRVILIAYVAQFHATLYQRWQHSGEIWTMLKDWVVKGETSTPERQEVFDNMRLPHAAKYRPGDLIANANVVDDDKTPPRVATEKALAPDYIDPGQPGVFWMATAFEISTEPRHAFSYSNKS